MVGKGAVSFLLHFRHFCCRGGAINSGGWVGFGWKRWSVFVESVVARQCETMGDVCCSERNEISKKTAEYVCVSVGKV